MDGDRCGVIPVYRDLQLVDSCPISVRLNLKSGEIAPYRTVGVNTFGSRAASSPCIGQRHV